MLQHPAFSAPGKFWRGNLHTHSTLSDGGLSPQEVCDRYRAEGYDFLCLSDHLIGRYGYPIADTKPYRTNSFTTLLGAEFHAGALENGELWHLLAVGLPEDFPRPNVPDFNSTDTEDMAALARRAREAGAYVAIVHPQWFNLSLIDALKIDAAHAVEVYNHGCYVECDRGDGIAMLDQLLCAGRELNLCATDDAHFRDHDAFGGWVMVKSESLDPEAILAALKAGHNYSTTGPDIMDFRVEGDRIAVSCSPASSVIALGHGAVATAVHGDGLTSALLPVERFRKHGWVRITVIDAKGKRAWTNPLRLN